LTLVASLLLVFAGSLRSFGQESRASLAGKVTDPQNAVVVGATVTVISVETGVVQTATTNQAGEWRVQFLNPGHYLFVVNSAGFKKAQHDAIELQVGDLKTADVQLQLGAVTETVNVGTDAPLIDTDAAVSGTVITTKELEELPSQSQVPTLLAGLTPGVVVGNGVSGAVYLWSNNGASQIQDNGSGSVAGSGAQNSNAATQYRLDGAYDSSSGGTIGFIPPQDSIAEFRVTSNAYDASIGRQSGATIDMVSKTGTKDFHGSLYEYNLNNFLNAKTWGNNVAPAVHTNQYGGTVGGPVWIPHVYDGRKRKTFFFFSYAGIHNTAPVNTGFMTVPSLLERQGDFSQTCFVTSGIIYGTGGGCTTTKTPVPATQQFTVYDPATINTTTGNRTAFAGNVIPSTRISPFATAILALIPLPDRAPDLGTSSDANNFVKKEVQRDVYGGYTIRLDQAWNNSNHSYANISRNNWTEASFNPFGGFANDVLNSFNQARKQEIATLDHNIVLNPRMVLDLKYSVLNAYGGAFSPSAHFNDSSLGLSSNFINQMPIHGIPLFTGVVNGAEQGGLGTANGGSYTIDTFQTIDADLTHSHGNHTFKYGFEHLIQQTAGGNPAASAGSFSFGSATNTSADSWTCLNPVKNCGASQGNGSNVAQFLLGLPLSGSIATNATAFWSQHYTAAYIQDNWRVTSKLTLDLGLRWDFQTGVTERFNRNYTRYDPTYVQTAVTTPSQAAYGSLLSTTPTATQAAGVQLLQAYRPNASTFVTTGAVDYSGVHGTPRTLYDPRYFYFQPRLGFAYLFHPTTVLRGGLGRFAQASFDTDSQNGFSATTNYTATSDNFYHGYTNPTTGSVSSLLNPYPDGLTAPTGNSLAEQTNIGSVTSYTSPNYGRVYVDEASASIQQQVHKFLFEIGGTYNRTHDLAVGVPSQGIPGLPTNAIPTNAYLAAFGPQFDSNGRPLDTLSGNTPVTNPYKGVAGLPATSSLYTSSTVNASQLLRPNPLVNGDIPVTTSGGKATYYAMLTKVERRYSNGFSLLQAFTWGRNFTQDFIMGNTSIGYTIPRQIYGNDVRFHYTLTPIYELPFGKGKLFLKDSNRAMEQLVGGWELTGIYNFQSGTPLTLPTNSSFYRGDPSPNTNVKKGRTGTYFDTTAFVPYPIKSTPIATIQATYPSWTGVSAMPGYGYVPYAKDTAQNGIYNDFNVRNTFYPQTFGDIRNPPTNTVTGGLRKNFNFTKTFRFQLRIDATNLLNHPQFGNISVDQTSAYFGKLSGANSPTTAVNLPRQIELAGKLYF
jgi:hypothetical protein